MNSAEHYCPRCGDPTTGSVTADGKRTDLCESCNSRDENERETDRMARIRLMRQSSEERTPPDES